MPASAGRGLRRSPRCVRTTGRPASGRGRRAGAGGSGVPDGVSSRRAGPVRPVVPAGGHPAGLRADRPPTGAGDGGRILTVITARMLPSRQAADLVTGHWDLLSGWNEVPRALVWDNEPAIGRRREGKPVLDQEFAALAGLLGC